MFIIINYFIFIFTIIIISNINMINYHLLQI